MFNFFKKEPELKIYRLRLYYEDGDLNRSYHRPIDLQNIWNGPVIWLTELLLYKYLLLHPNKYKDYKLKIAEKKSNNRYDVEKISPDMHYSSERFKNFCEREKLPFDFFPVSTEEGERGYMMMWRGLPVITDYEVDIKRSKYNEKNFISNHDDCMFSSNFVEYYGYKVFCSPSYTYIYITGDIKDKLEQENFKFTFKEMKVTQKKLDREKIKKDLVYVRQMERKKYFNENSYKVGYERLQAVDDYLEEVLVKEGDKEVLEKFRKQMKGVWKRDFEKYDKGLLEPLEKITYW